MIRYRWWEVDSIGCIEPHRIARSGPSGSRPARDPAVRRAASAGARRVRLHRLLPVAAGALRVRRCVEHRGEPGGASHHGEGPRSSARVAVLGGSAARVAHLCPQLSVGRARRDWLSPCQRRHPRRQRRLALLALATAGAGGALAPRAGGGGLRAHRQPGLLGRSAVGAASGADPGGNLRGPAHDLALDVVLPRGGGAVRALPARHAAGTAGDRRDRGLLPARHGEQADRGHFAAGARDGRVDLLRAHPASPVAATAGVGGARAPRARLPER